MKRKANGMWTFSDAKRRKQQRALIASTQRPFIGPLPRRAYSNSMVPLRTGGYRPNNVELKVADTTSVQMLFDADGTFQLLALPQLGSDFNQRVGRKIMLKTLFIRGQIAQNTAYSTLTASTRPGGLCRLIVFLDMQPNGTAPLYTDLLNLQAPWAQLNLNNRDRFKVLKDKIVALDPFVYNTTSQTSAATGANTVKVFKFFKNINIETIFNGTNGGTIADINSGALWLFTIGNWSTQAPTLEFTARVRYNDA